MEHAGVGSHISPYQKQIRNWRKGQNTWIHEDKSSGNDKNQHTQYVFFQFVFDNNCFSTSCASNYMWKFAFNEHHVHKG